MMELKLGEPWRVMTYEEFSALNIQGQFLADRRHGEVSVWLRDQITEALSRLSLEGGGEKASCTDSTDAPACGAATSTACQPEWRPISQAPAKPSSHIRVRSITVYRWLAYKPDGARQMKKPGRWQRHDGYGFTNAELPENAEWSFLPEGVGASVAVAEPAKQRAQTGWDRDDQQSQATERLREERHLGIERADLIRWLDERRAPETDDDGYPLSLLGRVSAHLNECIVDASDVAPSVTEPPPEGDKA